MHPALTNLMRRITLAAAKIISDTAKLISFTAKLISFIGLTAKLIIFDCKTK